MQEKRLEWKVGLFVCSAIFILCVMILFFGDNDFFKKGYDLKVHFHFTNGVKIGAPVRFAGVEIGKVKEIHILNDGSNVELVLWIQKGIVIREDASIYINTLGVMGEKYIEFVGGTVRSAILKPGWAPLRGVDPIPINEMLSIAQNVAREVNGLVTSVRSILDDPQTISNIKDIFANTKELTGNLKQLTSELNLVVNENRVSLYKSIESFRNSSDALHEDLSLVKNILTKIDNKEGTLGLLVGDDSIYKNLNEFVLDLKANPWKLLIKTKSVPITNTANANTTNKKKANANYNK